MIANGPGWLRSGSTTVSLPSRSKAAEQIANLKIRSPHRAGSGASSSCTRVTHLAAERTSQAQLVEARTKAEALQIEARAKAEIRRLEVEAQVSAKRLELQAEAEAQASARRLAAQAEADAGRIRTEAEAGALAQAEKTAAIYASSRALLRLKELEALEELARSVSARIYIGFDKHLSEETPAG